LKRAGEKRERIRSRICHSHQHEKSPSIEAQKNAMPWKLVREGQPLIRFGCTLYHTPETFS